MASNFVFPNFGDVKNHRKTHCAKDDGNNLTKLPSMKSSMEFTRTKNGIQKHFFIDFSTHTRKFTISIIQFWKEKKN